MQQQPQPFPPQTQPDPFNTDAFGQTQFGQTPVPAQPQQVQPPQQPSFATFPPPGEQSPQHGAVEAPTTQRQPPAQQDAFGAMPVQKDPFKDDPFFTQGTNDRYAAFATLAAQSDFGVTNTEAFHSSPSQPPAQNVGMFDTLQPTPASQAAPQAPPSPQMGEQRSKEFSASSAFQDLDKLADFQPSSKYIDRSQFFKPKNTPPPSLSEMNPNQVGSPNLSKGDSPHQSRRRPKTSVTADPFGSSPATDPFGSAPFTQPVATFDSKEPDPFDTSAIIARTQLQGPFDPSELKPASAFGLAKSQNLDVSASSSTPPTTRSDKLIKDGTTSSNVSTPEDFSLPSPELPPPPLPKQGAVEIPDEAPAPPPRPTFSTRPSMTRQSTIDVGAISRKGLKENFFSRQATVDFTEETPPAIPPRPPSSGPTSQTMSLPDTPPPNHTPPPLPHHTPPARHRPLPAPQHTPPPLPKHDVFQSQTLPRQHTLPPQTHHTSMTLSRQTTLPTYQKTPQTPPLSSRLPHTPPVLPQQDQFSFPPFDAKTSPPPFQAFTKKDPFISQATPPASPRSVQRSTVPLASQSTPPLSLRQEPFPTVWHDSSSFGQPSPTASPTPGFSPSPTGTSMVARPRPRPRPRTPGGPQQSPTLSQVPENAKSPPLSQTTPPVARSFSQPGNQASPDPFSRESMTRHSERFPPDSFTREAHLRQSDRTDVQTAARRVDNVKALLRGNQSEPVFSVLATETITVQPERPKEDDRDSSSSATASQESKADPFPEGVDPFIDDSPIDPFSENDPFNNDLTQQPVAFRTKAIGSKDSESVKGSVSDPFVEDPFANDPFFTSGGKGTPVVSSPALARQGRKKSQDSTHSDVSRSRTTSERSTSESQHDSSQDPFSTVPMRKGDVTSKLKSDTPSTSTSDPFVVDWGAGTKSKASSDNASSQDGHISDSFKNQSNVSSASDLAEGQVTKTATDQDPFDSTVNGVSDSESARTDSASLHSDPFASLDPFKFALGSKKPEQSSWPTVPSSTNHSLHSDSPRTMSPFRDPFVVDPGLKVNGSSQSAHGDTRVGQEGTAPTTSSDNIFPSSSPQPPNGTSAPSVPARQFPGNPFAAPNQVCTHRLKGTRYHFHNFP